MAQLPKELERKYKEVTELFSVSEQEMQENSIPLPQEDIIRAALDFLILYVEHVAAHRDSFPDEDWQAFLVDFAHAFTYSDESGEVHSALASNDVDSLIYDCCALDDEGTSKERLQTLREELFEIRARLDELELG